MSEVSRVSFCLLPFLQGLLGSWRTADLQGWMHGDGG